jgi:hypothetical protein
MADVKTHVHTGVFGGGIQLYGRLSRKEALDRMEEYARRQIEIYTQVLNNRDQWTVSCWRGSKKISVPEVVHATWIVTWDAPTHDGQLYNTYHRAHCKCDWVAEDSRVLKTNAVKDAEYHLAETGAGELQRTERNAGAEPRPL